MTRTQWFIAGLVLLVLLSMYAPRVAGALTILLVAVLAIGAARKKLI
jgi:hypothetical protein